MFYQAKHKVCMIHLVKVSKPFEYEKNRSCSLQYTWGPQGLHLMYQ